MTSVKLINHSSSTADWNYYSNIFPDYILARLFAIFFNDRISIIEN